MTAETTIDYLRHGAPLGGARYRGQIDDPLSELGWAQMRAAVVGEPSWDCVISSPLKRCQAFASEVAQACACDVVEDRRLMEVGFGEWEGMTGKEIDARWPDARRQFYLDPVANRPVGAEPLAAFSERCASAWEDIVRNYVGKRVLVVAHAGVIRATLGYVSGVPLERIYRFQVANASLSRWLLTSARPPQLLFHGREVASVNS